MEKVQKILFEDKQKPKKDFKESALITCCHNYQSTKVSSCQNYEKLGYKKDFYL